MATNSFLGFSEDGSQLFEMKSKMARQVGDDASDSVKSTIRETLGVPASAEGLTPANNLSDVASAATSRTNLDVMSTGDVNDRALGKALSSGIALTASATDPHVNLGDNDLFSFVTGQGRSIIIVAEVDDIASNGDLVCKYGSGTSTREFLFGFLDSGKLTFYAQDSSANAVKRQASSASTAQSGKIACWGMSYSGASVASSAMDDVALYEDGELVTSTATNNGSFAGFHNSGQRLSVGRPPSGGGNDWTGKVFKVLVFNRELSAAEHAWIAQNGPEIADQWGGSEYASDFSSGVDGWTANAGTAAGNIDAIGGQDNNLRLTLNTASAQHYLKKDGYTSGKRYKISLDFYIPSTNSNVDGVRIWADCDDGFHTVASEVSPTLDSWQSIAGELTDSQLTMTAFAVLAQDGGSASFADSGGDDVLYIRNVTITQVGAVVALLPTPGSIESDGTWLDSSSNELNGTPTGVTPLITRPSQRGTFTPTVSFAGSSTGVTYSEQLGTWERVGERAIAITGRITLTSKGTHGASSAVKLEGLPFTSRNANDSSLLTVTGVNLSSLTSAVVGMVYANNTTAKVLHYGASGEVQLDWDNFTDTTVLLFSGTYLIP